MTSTTLPFMTFHGSFKALSRLQFEQHPRMTISNLPLRIPVHFQPIKPTSDLQVIFEWIIYIKHTLSSPVTLNISISVARLCAPDVVT